MAAMTMAVWSVVRMDQEGMEHGSVDLGGIEPSGMDQDGMDCGSVNHDGVNPPPAKRRLPPAARRRHPPKGKRCPRGLIQRT